VYGVIVNGSYYRYLWRDNCLVESLGNAREYYRYVAFVYYGDLIGWIYGTPDSVVIVVLVLALLSKTFARD